MKKNVISGLILMLCTFVFAQVSAQDNVNITIHEPQDGGTRQVDINLENPNVGNYTAFQLDVKLPNGFVVADDSPCLTSRLSAHNLSVARQENGCYRFTAWSASNVAIIGNSGAILTFNMVKDPNVEVNKGVDLYLTADNIRFSTRVGEEFIFTVATSSFVESGNAFVLSYMLDGELYKQVTCYEGAKIVPLDEPTKVGYTFSGWDGLPEVMPAHDVTVNGTFTINSYQVVFKIGDEVISTINVEYGKVIETPSAPEKEGHTFAGWQDIPATMPATDIVITGRYDVNSYKLCYMLDGEVYKEFTITYGTTITAEQDPTKEGYTFSGWDGLPEVMPANDVTVNGTFTINSYTITYYLDGEFYAEQIWEYDAKITPPEVNFEETNRVFTGWECLPDRMPATDLVINGASFVDAINNAQTVESAQRVYDLQGKYVGNTNDKNLFKRMKSSIYIIDGKKVLVR